MMTYTYRNNPWLPQIDTAAVAEVVAERIDRKAHDELLLAHAARSDVERRLRQADSTAYGVAVDSVTGKAITPEEITRIEARLEDMQAAYLTASRALSQAAAQLNNLKKNSEVWEREQNYWRGQAADEAARTPEERAIRARREAQATR